MATTATTPTAQPRQRHRLCRISRSPSGWRVARPLETRCPVPATPPSHRRPIGLIHSRYWSSRRRRGSPSWCRFDYGRMLVSPFTFYRGGAMIMAGDLAATPRSGFTVQCCGDAHLSNFGVFASPERRLVFDLNDFDETLPGPWEWDVKRLAVSMLIAAHQQRLPGQGSGADRPRHGQGIPHLDGELRGHDQPRRLVRARRHRLHARRARLSAEAEDGQASRQGNRKGAYP